MAFWEGLRDAPWKPMDYAASAVGRGAMGFAKGAFGLSTALAPFAMRMGAMVGSNVGRLGMAAGQGTVGAAKDASAIGQFLLTGSLGFGEGPGGFVNPKNWMLRPKTNGGLMPNLFKAGINDPLERLSINPRVGRRVLWGAAAIGAVQGVSKIMNDAPEPSVYISADGTPRRRDDMGATGDWAKSMRRKK